MLFISVINYVVHSNRTISNFESGRCDEVAIAEMVRVRLVSFSAAVRSDEGLVRWCLIRVAYTQAMLRRSTYGRMTRAEEERMRSDNRRREDCIDDHKRMLAQDKLMRYVSG